jgi:hypothetical protein
MKGKASSEAKHSFHPPPGLIKKDGLDARCHVARNTMNMIHLFAFVNRP